MEFAATILVLAALFGLTMVILRLRGRPRPPTWFALSHGLVAGFGVTTLGVAWARYGLPPLAKAAFVVFVLAALGGLTLFVLFHLKNRALPIGLMLVHGLVALSGLTMLLLALRDVPPDELYQPPEPDVPAVIEIEPATPPPEG
jgi:hypothetical protein